MVDPNHENKPNTAESWEQAAHNANTGKPREQGFDYTDPTTGTRVICLHQLKSIDGDGVSRWFSGGKTAWCDMCNPDNVSATCFSSGPRGEVARGRHHGVASWIR